jgi:hypothetical protein
MATREEVTRIQLRGQAISNLEALSRRHGWRRYEVVERLIEVALSTDVGRTYLGQPVGVTEETLRASA